MIGIMAENLLDAINELTGRLTAAEAQLATERARHAAMASEFEKIATGTHPGYWMLEPGDVLFRVAETRHVRYGEWFCGAHGDLDCWYNRYESVDEYQVYRRIDAPADAASGGKNHIADAGKMVAPSPHVETGGQEAFNWLEVRLARHCNPDEVVIAASRFRSDKLTDASAIKILDMLSASQADQKGNP
jgi:hypothetical protein